MARSTFAIACCFAFPLATSGTALAESACGGVVITDVIETVGGERIQVGERCYERSPGVPFYYDAPGKGPRMGVESFSSTPASITRFEASAIQALDAQPISDLVNPLPPGQGEADRQPE